MKITVKNNFRVVVTPRRLGDYGSIRVSDTFFGRKPEDVQRDYQQRCDEIVEQIKRHVDEVGYVEIECDTEDKCSHCGSDWHVSTDDMDPEFPTGTPYCCDRAVEEFKNTPK